MPRFFKRLRTSVFTPEQLEQLRKSTAVNSAGYDPWGLNLETAELSVRALRYLYEDYFRVQTVGINNVPQGRVMLVPNHAGQLPLDGILITLAMMLEAQPPRIVRGMVERFFPTLPFIGTWFIRCGQVVGDPRNCEELLERDQTIMVFPEGVRGSGKLYKNRYQLQSFGTGFVRLALETRTPIVPVAVIGSEETYPGIYNPKWLARMAGVPYVPVTPFFPLLGPAGMLPLPVRIQLRFGKPIQFDGDPDEREELTRERVETVRRALDDLIGEGLAERPNLSRGRR